MSNRDMIETRLKEVDSNYVIGCYDSLIDKLSKGELNNILKNIDEEYTDIDVMLRGKLHVVEISTVDNEKDFNVLTKEEYISRYGDERWADA